MIDRMRVNSASRAKPVSESSRRSRPAVLARRDRALRGGALALDEFLRRDQRRFRRLCLVASILSVFAGATASRLVRLWLAVPPAALDESVTGDDGAGVEAQDATSGGGDGAP